MCTCLYGICIFFFFDCFECIQVKDEVQYQIEQNEHVVDELNKNTRKSPYKASWIEQFRATLWRSFLSVVKEPMLMQIRFVQTAVRMCL